MSIHSNNDIIVDAVITWVDGSDEKHIKKMMPYLKLNNKDITNKKFRTRFNQVEEIEFAIKSILKYAPYVRTIFLVTDQQIPTFLKNTSIAKNNFSKVKIIDHSVIFSGHENVLPTFNSLPIETMLYRIPGLAEHFVYFNDDLFLIKKTVQSDFFVDSNPVLRGKWKRFDTNIWYKKIHQKGVKFLGGKTKDQVYGHKRGQQYIAKKIGFYKRYYKFDHTPAPMRKSTIKKYFTKNPDMEIMNISYRFREAKQFTMQSLANHIEIKRKTCILKNDYQLVYFQSYRKPLFWIKLKLSRTKNNNKLFLCMQSLDMCPPKKLNAIFAWLKNELV